MKVMKLVKTLVLAGTLVLLPGCSAGGVAGSAEESGVMTRSGETRAFPSQQIYPGSSLRPSSYTQDELDFQVRDFYNQWKARYFTEVEGSNPPQAFSHYNLEYLNSPRKAVTVSEQHGYAMVIEAYLGNQADFDKMVAFYQAHMSLYAKPNEDIDPPNHMMCWQQLAGKKGAIVDVSKGPDSATDGDEDIAYALLLADKQWGSLGMYNYKEMALNIIRDFPRVMIGSSALPGVVKDPVLWLGDWTIHNYNNGTDKWLGSTRPSDWMFSHYTSWISALEEAGNLSDAVIISDMRNLMYSIADRINTVHAPETGLMPDFILKSTNGVYDENGTYNPPVGALLEGTRDETFSWNACRVPWRFGTDVVLSGNTELLPQLQKMNEFFKSVSGRNPSLITTGYELDGTPTGSGSDMAFTAPLLVSAMVPMADGSWDQAWLDTLWDYVVNNPLMENADCYGNTIKLQAMIIASGNWWLPQESVTGSLELTGSPEPE